LLGLDESCAYPLGRKIFWESTGQMALNRTRITPSDIREPFLAAIEICALHIATQKVCSAPGGVWFVLMLHFFF
jgi:hypothetical protein